MKCEYCNGNLDLEAKVCPYCGQPNRQAQQHINDMAKYQGQFENTQKDVYSAAHKYSNIVVRVIIAAILLAALVVVFMLRSNSYHILRTIKNAGIRSNKSVHTAVIDRYLEDEDFIGFSSYCERNWINGFDDGFSEYRRLLTSAQNYSYIYNELVKQTFPPGYLVGEPRKLELFGDYLGSFYDSLDPDMFYGLSEEQVSYTVKYQNVMEEHLEALLQTYCHLSKEEAADLKNMSKAKRVLLIEERMGDVE